MNLGVKAVTDEVFKNREQHSLSFSQSRLWILLVYDNSAVIFLRGNVIKKKNTPQNRPEPVSVARYYKLVFFCAIWVNWAFKRSPLWLTVSLVMAALLQSHTCPVPPAVNRMLLLLQRGRRWRMTADGGNMPLPSDKNQPVSFELWQHWNLTLPTTQESLHTKPSVTQQVVTRKTQHFPPGGLAMQIPSVVPSLSFFSCLFFSSFVPFSLSQCFSSPSRQEQLVGFISSLSLSN